MPISNPKPDLHDISAHTKFGENPLTFTQIIVRKWKYGRTYDRWADGQTDGRAHGTNVWYRWILHHSVSYLRSVRFEIIAKYIEEAV